MLQYTVIYCFATHRMNVCGLVVCANEVLEISNLM